MKIYSDTEVHLSNFLISYKYCKNIKNYQQKNIAYLLVLDILTILTIFGVLQIYIFISSLRLYR